MESTYKLVWSDEALNNLKKVIKYLEERWTEREIKKFAQLLDHQLKLINNNPMLFPISQKSPNVRKSVLSKQTTIYYKVVENQIRIITLFDNRQNPDSLKFHK